MKKIMPLLALAVMFGACSVSTANVSVVSMCPTLAQGEMTCATDTATFVSNTPEIFITTQLDNAPTGTKVTFQWRYLEGSAPEVIDSVVVESPEVSPSYPNSSLPIPPGGLWPAGKYDVVVSLDTDNSEPIVKAFVVK